MGSLITSEITNDHEMTKALEAINYLYGINRRKVPPTFLKKLHHKDSVKAQTLVVYFRKFR
ncbi:MAG: hypothetical protein ACXADY_26645 [Candidatus Hodarchaeales archaeon]